MKVGLFFELHSDYSWREGDPPDADAEYEPEETLLAVEGAFRLLGHETERVGGAHSVLRNWDRLNIDVAFNIAEGAHSRNREAYVPVLLELARIPCLGSDALTLSLSLDKAHTKDLVKTTGVQTPPFHIFHRGRRIDVSALQFEYPVIVKPRYEGSAKGLSRSSVVHNDLDLDRQVAHVMRAYEQDALVERFVDRGGEYTVSIIGNDPPEPLPVLQRAVEVSSGIGIHALEGRGRPHEELQYEIAGVLTPELEERLSRDALLVYEKLECLDYARVDFRVDEEGEPWFLEINPLPTFAPDGTFAVVAELMGSDYVQLLADVYSRGLRRLGLTND